MKDENDYTRLEELAKENDMEIYKISAATNKGLNTLFNRVSEVLKDLPKEELYEEEESEKVYTLNNDKEDFTISKKDGVYVVEGKAIEKLLKRVNMEDNESLYYFQKSIKSLGVEERLKAMGIKEGDTVKFIIWEFEWYD